MARDIDKIVNEAQTGKKAPKKMKKRNATPSASRVAKRLKNNQSTDNSQ